ncbi:hypothetical protein C2845_PM03G28780 [Panicum miliaceum]|uniref:DUF7597 domain-containing protein n=1 Tax=Panicum miliaceum TaxID=4540 RepID=A0A3L6TBQ8_PANMI|nr:hypothetical protein C2845_PM03G28780 [Panicum miliaceum]
MANFPCNPMLYVPMGQHVEQGWLRPARCRVALGGEPPRRHEQYAIISLLPEPLQAQVPDLIRDVTEAIEDDFLVRVVSAFPSPLGLGLFQLESPVQRQVLLDASPIPFAHGHLTVQKHDEARNLRVCNCLRQCWVMFLAFPLDYQTLEFIKASVAPFGRLLHWYEGPNKSRVFSQCLVLSPERVPRSIVISQGSVLGGNGRSWSVPVFILGGHFPDAFPADEDPVPADGNPHPVHGQVQQGNINIEQHWHHDFVGAANAVQGDAGINNAQADVAAEDLAVPNDQLAGEGQNDGWPEWPDWMQEDGVADNMDMDNNVQDELQEQLQESISFDQSGSTAEYLRATGPDIALSIEDVLQGRYAPTSPPVEPAAADLKVQSLPCVAF